MGLLAVIERGVKEILDITLSEGQPQSSARKTFVIEGAGSENTDDFKGSSGEPANPASQENLGQLKEAMEVKLQRAGLDIDAEQLLKRMLQHSNINSDEISEQKKLLEAMNNEIDHFIALKSEISEQTDINEVIAKSIQNVYEAVVESGIDITFEEFNEMRGNIPAELGERFKQANPEERRIMMEEFAAKEKAAFERYLEAELSKVPESERAVKEQEIRKTHEYVIRARFLDFMTQDSETALNAIVMLSADDMDYGIEAVFETRCDEAERSRTADMADYEFTDGLQQSYYARGEKVSAETMRSYTSINVGAKSTEAARQYQTDYETARNAWESGESRPEYMSRELFTATAQGIGEGVMSNANMTSDEKAEFIAAWKECASKYDDYEKVVQKVCQELEKDGNKELAGKVRAAESKKAAGNSASVENSTQTGSESGSQSAATSTSQESAAITAAFSPETGINNAESTEPPVSDSSSTCSNISDVSASIIFSDIQANGLSYSDAVEKYGEESVIAAALDNDVFSAEVKAYLHGADPDSVIRVAQKCGKGNSIVVIYGSVNEESRKALEETEILNNLSYALKKLIQEIREQNEPEESETENAA